MLVELDPELPDFAQTCPKSRPTSPKLTELGPESAKAPLKLARTGARITESANFTQHLPELVPESPQHMPRSSWARSNWFQVGRRARTGPNPPTSTQNRPNSPSSGRTRGRIGGTGEIYSEFGARALRRGAGRRWTTGDRQRRTDDGRPTIDRRRLTAVGRPTTGDRPTDGEGSATDGSPRPATTDRRPMATARRSTDSRRQTRGG